MLKEGSISIEVPPSCVATRFDGPSHGLSHCMKAVDFIIRTPGSIIFLELKDPDDGPQDRRDEWHRKLTAGVIDNDLKVKFRDTWLYLYGLNTIDLPINFLVLIGLSTLSTETLRVRTESLKRKIPFEGPHGRWANEIVAGCSVHNIESWNRSFADFKAERLNPTHSAGR